MSSNEVVLLLGSNLGDRKKNIEWAVNRLQTEGCEIIKSTTIMETIPVEFVSCNNFCNIALLIKTQFSPIKLLNLLKFLEAEVGRKEDSAVLGMYNDRLLDMDIVFFGNVEFFSKRLKVPHYKNAFERDFSKQLILELKLKK